MALDEWPPHLRNLDLNTKKADVTIDDFFVILSGLPMLDSLRLSGVLKLKARSKPVQSLVLTERLTTIWMNEDVEAVSRLLDCISAPCLTSFTWEIENWDWEESAGFRDDLLEKPLLRDFSRRARDMVLYSSVTHEYEGHQIDIWSCYSSSNLVFDGILELVICISLPGEGEEEFRDSIRGERHDEVMAFAVRLAERIGATAPL
jgi:hypothetical protein